MTKAVWVDALWSWDREKILCNLSQLVRIVVSPSTDHFCVYGADNMGNGYILAEGSKDEMESRLAALRSELIDGKDASVGDEGVEWRGRSAAAEY